MMNIQFQNRQRRYDPAFYRNLARRVFDSAQERLEALQRIDVPVSIFLTLAGPNVMRKVNREHRSVDATTDVLSFPMHEFKDGRLKKKLRDGDVEIGPDGARTLFLGDLFLSPDRAEAQAEAYGHSLEREAAFLMVHGLLHLLGYDHQNRRQDEAMQALAESVLEPIGLGRPGSKPFVE